MANIKVRLFLVVLMLLTFTVSGSLLYAECEGDGCSQPDDSSAVENSDPDPSATQAPQADSVSPEENPPEAPAEADQPSDASEPADESVSAEESQNEEPQD